MFTIHLEYNMIRKNRKNNMINYAKKYRIVQHEVTKKYKVQKKFLGLFWCDVHEHYSTLDLQYAQELMNDLIKDDIAEDRSLWKSI